MPELSLPQEIAVWAIPVLLAVTLHEAAHALIAYTRGDTTAKMLGRLTLNPLKHVDPIGTIIVPLVFGVLTQFQFLFGWAKPVPINWNQLRRPRVDMALVAAAGPVSNLIMALIWAACLKIAMILNPQQSTIALFLFFTARAGILINLILGFLNLIPIPPLDGSKIVASILPPRQSISYLRIEPFGFLIIILLLLTGVLSWILTPILNWSLYFISVLFHL